MREISEAMRDGTVPVIDKLKLKRHDKGTIFIYQTLR